MLQAPRAQAPLTSRQRVQWEELKFGGLKAANLQCVVDGGSSSNTRRGWTPRSH